jgi:hypothetical protein
MQQHNNRCKNPPLVGSAAKRRAPTYCIAKRFTPYLVVKAWCHEPSGSFDSLVDLLVVGSVFGRCFV